MKLKIKFQNVLAEHYDLIFGFIFFVSYRVFFTWLLWHRRTVPPEPDDSYYYLASAKHFLNANTFEEFRLLPFSLWLNFLSLFTYFNLETAYKLNFYIGPVAMFAAVYYFVSKLEKSRFIRTVLLTVIALYSGSGDYHGFYWVVASFYQLAFFLVIFATLISEKKTKPYIIFPACFLFIFVHPTSAFLSIIFVLYPITFLLFSRAEANRAFRNLIPVLIVLICSEIAYILIGSIFPSPKGYQFESFQTQTSLIKDFLSGKLNPISFPVIWREYFAIFFNNIVTTVTYFVMFVLLFYLKKYKLFAIFFSISIVVFLSSFIPYGSRSLGFLWPMTFFVIGYFLVAIWKLLQPINSKIKFGFLTAIPLVCLFVLATIFNTIFLSSLNATKNYNWDRSCPLKLQDKNTYFTSLESMNAFLSYESNEKNSHFLSQDEINNFLNVGNVLVDTKNETQQPQILSGFENFLTSKITRRNKITYVQYPANAFTTPTADSSSISANLNKKSLKISEYLDCGHFQVSVVNKL